MSLPYAWLNRGSTWTFGNVDLILQNDGNLVMYRKGNHSIVYWKTNTVGSGATQLLFQRDGNLVLYTANYARAVWASGTSNKCGGWETPALSTQGDSNMVVYCATRIGNGSASWAMDDIWSTKTNGV